MTVRQLMRRRASGASYRFFLMFSTALVLLLTMDISVNAVWGEIMWINARDQPGGVTLFIETQLSNWYQAWGSSTAVGLTLLSDALLVSTSYLGGRKMYDATDNYSRYIAYLLSTVSMFTLSPSQY